MRMMMVCAVVLAASSVHAADPNSEKQGLKITAQRFLIDSDHPKLRDRKVKDGYVPVAVKVYIYKGALDSADLKSQNETAKVQKDRLTATSTTDNEGLCQIPLPAGEYTVLMEVDGMLYTSSWNGKKTQTAIVQDNKFSEVTISDESIRAQYK